MLTMTLVTLDVGRRRYTTIVQSVKLMILPPVLSGFASVLANSLTFDGALNMATVSIYVKLTPSFSTQKHPMIPLQRQDRILSQDAIRVTGFLSLSPFMKQYRYHVPRTPVSYIWIATERDSDWMKYDKEHTRVMVSSTFPQHSQSNFPRPIITREDTTTDQDSKMHRAPPAPPSTPLPMRTQVAVRIRPLVGKETVQSPLPIQGNTYFTSNGNYAYVHHVVCLSRC
jgi:hypothetical protein